MLLAHPNEPAAPEAPRRRFRKLRIAWSVGWGIACVLLAVLWVRSYYVLDFLRCRLPNSWGLQAVSTDGRLILHTQQLNPTLHWPSWAWTSHKDQSSKDMFPRDPSVLGFQLERIPPNSRFQMPHWFVVSITVALSAAILLRQPYRFSLRTLLFVTTLVAVVLGLIVWVRRP
jgi:hypothetical protein